MFLSFMPIKYRELVQKLKAESNILYRQQRISSKVIQTNDRGTDIQLVDAPMSEPTVQYALRDAEYATLGAARSHMERGVALRKRILSDSSTRVLPKSAPPEDQPPPSFLQNTAATRCAPNSANARKEARTKVVHDRQPTELVMESEDQQDDHDDQPPSLSQLHPRVRVTCNGPRDRKNTFHPRIKMEEGNRTLHPLTKERVIKGNTGLHRWPTGISHHPSFQDTTTRLPHNEYSNRLVGATRHAYQNHRLQQGKQSVIRNRLQPI